MRVLVCGGRKFDNYHKVEKALNSLPTKPSLIIQGGAKGADSLARQWAESKGIYCVEINALWNFYGNKAGPKRNQAMIDIMKPEYCVALPGGVGTRDMIERCKSNNITTWEPYS